MRCLVIDDDESARLLMCQLVGRSGHEATPVTGCDEALERLEAGGYSVAIVDMDMPDRDGASTIAELRARSPELRVLVVSGHDERRYILAALEAGANGYLLKDDVSELLSATLRDLEAGYTLLSPRLASSSLRRLLRVLGRPVVDARSEPRSRTDLEPVEPPE